MQSLEQLSAECERLKKLLAAEARQNQQLRKEMNALRTRTIDTQTELKDLKRQFEQFKFFNRP